MTDKIYPYHVYGLHRTCTNLLRTLFNRNTPAMDLREFLEWKHAQIWYPELYYRGTRVLYIVSVRNIFAWLLSCYKYFREEVGKDGTICGKFTAGMSFDDFCRSPHYTWETPVDRWNEMYAHYLGVADAGFAVMSRSEDLQGPQAQLREMRRLCTELNIPMKEDFRPERFRVSNIGDVTGNRMNFGYYSNRRYMEKYTNEQYDYVASRVDWSLSNRLGYQSANLQPKATR